MARDDPAILRLLLAHTHLLQFESLENPEDINRVASILEQVASGYSVQAQHEPELNGLGGRMLKAKWVFFRTWKDSAASGMAYVKTCQAIGKNSVCPLWNMTEALLACADLLRICLDHFKTDKLRIQHVQKQKGEPQNGI